MSTMEKEHQPESLSTVTVKPDYPPSEIYSSEPPPAYHKPQSSAVQVAKIVAVTVVLVSVVLGSFILASAYVTANASCRQLEQELELLQEAADRFQQPPQPEALIQEEPLTLKRHIEPLTAETQKHVKEMDNNKVDEPESKDDSDSPSDYSSNSSNSEEDDDDEKTPIHFKLPLQLDFDDLAGALIEKNQKSRMNCVVEKKRAEEVVDHQPKTVRLPFGLNLTTDPRYERLSGERMAIFCESGNVQSHAQPEQDEEEETIMIQPVMIPIPASHFPTHMSQQMVPVPQQQPPHYQNQIPIHPMETMRPPMPPMVRPMPMHPLIQFQQQPQQLQQQQQQQMQEEDQEQQQSQNSFPPVQVLQHIAQQIITQKIMEAEKQREEERMREVQRMQEAQQQQQPEVQRMQRIHAPEGMLAQVAHRLPIPEEVLTQLNRLPNREVIVAVQQQPTESEEEPTQELRIVQQPRQSAQEMNGRQTYARGLPIDIPVPMMQQVQEEQEPQAEQSEPQEQVAVVPQAEEEPRPHYVQPRSVRSVRSVDALLPKSSKRVKRCSCDCSC